MHYRVRRRTEAVRAGCAPREEPLPGVGRTESKPSPIPVVQNAVLVGSSATKQVADSNALPFVGARAVSRKPVVE